MRSPTRRVALALLAALGLVASIAIAPRAEAGLLNKLLAPAPVTGFTKALQLHQQKFDDNSLNWGGYYVTGNNITQARTTVVTPKPKLIPPTLAASWVGIGGAGTTDLIQAGVAYGYVDPLLGLPVGTSLTYYAWYELLPAGITPITSGCTGAVPSFAVTVGDVLDVDIHTIGVNNFNISIVNRGKWAWSMNTPYVSSLSSAEWIYEAPSRSIAGVVPLYGIPNAVTADFYSNQYTINGVGKLLQQSEATTSFISPAGFINEATPSPIRANSNFSVCSLKQSCTAP